MITVFLILALTTFVITILSAIGKAPLWIAVMIIALIELLRALPIGK